MGQTNSETGENKQENATPQFYLYPLTTLHCGQLSWSVIMTVYLPVQVSIHQLLSGITSHQPPLGVKMGGLLNYN